MAAEIKSATGLQPELIGGVNGVFDIVADGKVIFSKHREGRFPNAGEITRSLAKLA